MTAGSQPWAGDTDLFIHCLATASSGLRRMLTNFHLPVLHPVFMLVSAFAGYETDAGGRMPTPSQKATAFSPTAMPAFWSGHSEE